MGERPRMLAGPLAGMTVLVAEADPAMREVLARALRSRFAKVVEAGSGTEALALCQRSVPDLAVLGAREPETGAAVLAAALRQASQRLPIFLAGAAEDILDVLSRVALPGLRLLVRPFDPASLAEAVEAAAQDVAARRSLEEAWGLVRFLLDESPQFSVIFGGEEVVSVNRAFLRFMGLSTFHEFRSRGADVDRFVAGPLPPGGLAAFARGLPDDRLDREHPLRLANPDRPEQPVRVFQAVGVRLPGRDRVLMTLSDVTELELERRELLDLANLDPLTRVCNRRKLQEILAEETARADRYGLPLGAMVLDIDHFKVINDTHGHDAGDAVLVELAGRLTRTLRQVDRLARFGGEEFVVVAPGIGLEAALELAERLRRCVADAAFVAAGRVTVSCGVAAHHPGEPAEAMLKRADEALYRAKAGGRNKVEPQALPQPPPR